MKVKLLKRLRRQWRSEITICSTTRTTDYSGSFLTGMSYTYNDGCYKGLFEFGDSVEDVLKKTERIGWRRWKNVYRRKYKKYTRLHKQSIIIRK